jgi:hypothetical protein
MNGLTPQRLLNDYARTYHGVPWREMSAQERQESAWGLFQLGVAMERNAIALRKTSATLNRIQHLNRKLL